MIYLSYILDDKTPSYGNKNPFFIEKKNSIALGGTANDSMIKTTVHIGTHIDLPYHFHDNGQTIEDYKPDFWFFRKPLVVEVENDGLIINETLVNKLKDIEDCGYDILIVKTGICNIRDSDEFWENNYGFHPDLYNFISEKYPGVRVLGFDSISVSSIQDRATGREAHRRFLNPQKPILLIEDMDLRYIDERIALKEIIVSPIRIASCDGLPCTIFGKIDD